MHAIKTILTRPFGSEAIDAKVAEFVCYGSALAFLILGMRKLSTLALTEVESLFGILLVLTIGLLTVCLGMLVRIAGQGRSPRSST